MSLFVTMSSAPAAASTDPLTPDTSHVFTGCGWAVGKGAFAPGVCDGGWMSPAHVGPDETAEPYTWTILVIGKPDGTVGCFAPQRADSWGPPSWSGGGSMPAGERMWLLPGTACPPDKATVAASDWLWVGSADAPAAADDANGDGIPDDATQAPPPPPESDCAAVNARGFLGGFHGVWRDGVLSLSFEWRGTVPRLGWKVYAATEATPAGIPDTPVLGKIGTSPVESGWFGAEIDMPDPVTSVRVIPVGSDGTCFLNAPLSGVEDADEDGSPDTGTYDPDAIECGTFDVMCWATKMIAPSPETEAEMELVKEKFQTFIIWGAPIYVAKISAIIVTEAERCYSPDGLGHTYPGCPEGGGSVELPHYGKVGFMGPGGATGPVFAWLQEHRTTIRQVLIFLVFVGFAQIASGAVLKKGPLEK